MKSILSKTLLSAAAFLALPPLAAAQQAAEKNFDPNFWLNTFGALVVGGAAVVFAVALYSIVRLFSVMVKMEELRILREKGIEEIVEASRQPQPSWWSRFLKAATRTVPLEQERDILLDHNYDGIRELDNRLPPWWLWMFYASIIFSVVYWFAYHLSDIGASPKEEYDRSMKTAKAQVAAYVATQADAVDESNVTALTDDGEISLGASIFKANCIACHGLAGEGNTVGPNLADDHWLNGCGIQNVFKTIKYGRVEKGMQAWSATMRSSDIQRVASFVLTLRGSNPPNAKAPQGEPCQPEEGQPPPPAEKPAATGG